MKTITLHQMPRQVGRLTAGVLLALGVLLPATALAAPVAATQPATCDLACLQAYGNTQIGNRITSLQTLSGKAAAYESANQITAAQAQVVENDVTTNSNGLSTLKSAIDTATMPSQARSLDLQIFTTYRIYAVVRPRDYRLLHVDIEMYVDSKLRALQPAIQAWINEAPPSIQQQMTPLYSDYTYQLGEAEAQIDAAQGQFGVLTPTNFNNDNAGYKSSLLDLESDEQAAHMDLTRAGSDLHQIAQLLRHGNVGATPTATPSSD